MKKLPEQIRFYLYLTREQADQVAQLRAAGVSVSTIARQSIRKCHSVPLLPEDDTPRSERCNVYLAAEDDALLSSVAQRENCSRARALRHCVSVYLSANTAAIEALFGQHPQ